MCGIAGIFSLDDKKLSKQTIIRFTDSMYHRGPDGSGYTLLENDTLALGHRRLSVLDLSEQGKQPMVYLENRYWITYNGEVFNFQQLKSELVNFGHKFFSDSDTEVILAAYLQWGKNCLTKFNGMFAFAIWDNKEKLFFLARDRFGIKPLYYTMLPGKFFAFASETRAFKFLDGFERSFDEPLLSLNLVDTYALEGLGYTPFKNIYQLLPSHYIEIDKTKEIEQKRWWHIKDHLSTNLAKTFNEQAEEFYSIFYDSCKLRLISDVPVATALSGGLDSTAVYATVHTILTNDAPNRSHLNSQKAFTAIFPNLPQNEKEYADKAVSFTKGKINYVEIDSSDLVAKIQKETELADFISNSPIASISAVYAGMRKEGITVSMDGHGVDEMLFGYRDMIHKLYNDSLWNGTLEQAKKYAEVLCNMYHTNSKQPAQQKFLKELNQKSVRDKKLIAKIKKQFYSNKPDNSYTPVNLPSLSNNPYNFSHLPMCEKMLYNEFFQHTLPALLRNFDRAGMMNSIEIRMPFMDWRLVSYVFSLPASSKLDNGFTKLILREAMKGKMDESLRTRTFKVGIGSPIEYWFNTNLTTWVLDTIKDTRLKNELEANRKLGWSKDLSIRAWREINVELIR